MAQTKEVKGNVAIAKARSLPVSTKHCIVISDFIRNKTLEKARDYLESVTTKKKAIPFKRFNNNMGHKPGMAAGRYPIKAVAEFLKLFKNVEANAQDKGLNTEGLKITKIVANKAAIPLTGGRRRIATKRTHLEIEVTESEVKKAVKKTVKKEEPVVEKKEESKVEEVQPVEKKVKTETDKIAEIKKKIKEEGEEQ
jgi:large subunit ribosomal protein L22